jgi:tetratricopeptide (TPR) repeat protein
VALLLGQVSLSAQLLPERSLVRQGNEQFERRNFYNSFNRYSEALEHAPGSYEALYNRANAYLHLMMSNPQDSTLTREVSNKYFEVIANNKYLSAEQRAEVLRNLGESLFLQQEYESALNAFRESLKLNPDDQETKRNYVLTKRIVDQKRDAQQRQQQQNQNQDQQNDQNQQNDKSQNDGGDNGQDPNSQNPNGNDQSQNEGENPDQQQEPEQDEGENPEDEGDQGGQQPESEGLSDEQERMLDAIQAEENKTQDKIKEGQKGVVIHGKKNW